MEFYHSQDNNTSKWLKFWMDGAEDYIIYKDVDCVNDDDNYNKYSSSINDNCLLVLS